MDKYTQEYTISQLLTEYPFVKDFLEDHLIPYRGKEHLTLDAFFKYLDPNIIEENAINPDLFTKSLVEYIDLMKQYFVSNKPKQTSITIYPGTHKDGRKESFDSIHIKSGEIIAIVGPTGSGKSRLLADIEWAANDDTPTGRTVHINGRALEPHERFSSSNKLVAQLSQNMNFVMDMTVEEFLDLHATSRLVKDKETIIQTIFNKANTLAGEAFTKDTPITELSGGQSRALMIADTAILSTSPIILIDEIENAGIDRKLALDLLVSEDKIVLMSTHDPILALMGDKRIVINNGGIDSIINSSEEERNILGKLEALDKTLMTLRQQLRYGKTIELKEEY
ncbi:MAG: ATP-binding cassette domain-containing protein [Candidatus Izemoplasma sp.]|nr:ATP-binding cassette domain-containing protein [Candidatus Izemoplasma sp.]